MNSRIASNSPGTAYSQDAPPQSRFLSHWDAIVFLGSALYLFLFFRHPWFAPDSGFIAAGAERIVRGQVPFRDFFSELGPGTYYLQAGFFKLLGVGLPAVNLTVWLTGLAISWLLYRLARKIIDGPLAVLPSFFFIAVCYPYWYCLSHHWTGFVFFSLMLLCMAEGASGKEGQPRAGNFLWLAAGLLSALAFLCMQAIGLAALGMGLAYLLASEKICTGRSWAKALQSSWQRGLCFATGFAAVFVAALLFFTWERAAHDWLYDNFTFLFTNYWSWENPPGNYWNTLTLPANRLLADETFKNLFYVIAYYFFLAVEPALVVFGSLWWFRNFRGSGNSRARLMLLYVLASIVMFFSELHNPDLVHFVLGSLLFPTVLVAITQACVHSHPGHRRWLLSAAAMLGAFAVAGAGWQIASARKRNTPVATRRGAVYVWAQDAGPLARRLNIIESRVPAGGQTLFFSFDAWLYFVTATRNPTRYDEVIAGFHTPAQIREITQTLLRERPQFIFSLNREEPWAIRTHFSGVPQGARPHPLEEFLHSPQSPYRLDGIVDLMEVWTLKK